MIIISTKNDNNEIKELAKWVCPCEHENHYFYEVELLPSEQVHQAVERIFNNKKYLPIDILLKSIKEFMPNEKVVVVDSHSEDKSYYDRVNEFGYDIIEGNDNYESGAIWMAYDKYPDEDFYFFLQDTTYLLRDMSKFYPKEKEVICIFGSKGFGSWSLESEPLEGGIGRLMSKSDMIKRVFQLLSEKDISFDYVGFYNKINHPYLEINQEEFYQFTYNMFISSNESMKELVEIGFNKILATDKNDSAIWEDLWGYAFSQIGCDEKILVNLWENGTAGCNDFVIKNFGMRI